MAGNPKAPPREVVVELTARDMAYEGMLRGLFDAWSNLLPPEDRDEARGKVLKRCLRMIDLVSLDDVPADFAPEIKAKASQRVTDVFGTTVRRTN